MGPTFSCGVLMGANVANEVALGNVCESTLACRFDTPELDEVTRILLDCPPTFRVQHIHDVAGAEVCGALKNVVALGAGFVDALEWGQNTKAALLRIGLLEMKSFGRLFFPTIEEETFWNSCGMADLITTCYGGRNRKCAEAFAKLQLQKTGKLQIESNKSNSQDWHSHKHGKQSTSSTPSTSMESFEQQAVLQEWHKIEAELLQGQKLQGTGTCREVYRVLQARRLETDFPLMCTIYKIAFCGQAVETIGTQGISQAYKKGMGVSRRPFELQSHL
jgi:glycerol-3-phosphate dehydrogenase (NAD+)